MCTSNGFIYEGYYKHDIAEGKGILINNNGYIYEGDFKNGKKEGRVFIIIFMVTNMKEILKMTKVREKG